MDNDESLNEFLNGLDDFDSELLGDLPDDNISYDMSQEHILPSDGDALSSFSLFTQWQLQDSAPLDKDAQHQLFLDEDEVSGFPLSQEFQLDSSSVDMESLPGIKKKKRSKKLPLFDEEKEYATGWHRGVGKEMRDRVNLKAEFRLSEWLKPQRLDEALDQQIAARARYPSMTVPLFAKPNSDRAKELLNIKDKLLHEVPALVRSLVARAYPVDTAKLVQRLLDTVQEAKQPKFRERENELKTACIFLKKVQYARINPARRRLVITPHKDELSMIKRILNAKGKKVPKSLEKLLLYELTVLARSSNVWLCAFVDVPAHRRDLDPELSKTKGLAPQCHLLPPFGGRNFVWRSTLTSLYNAVRFGWDPVRIWMNTPGDKDQVSLEKALVHCANASPVLQSPCFSGKHQHYAGKQSNFSPAEDVLPRPWFTSENEFWNIRDAGHGKALDLQLIEAHKSLIEAHESSVESLKVFNDNDDDEEEEGEISKLSAAKETQLRFVKGGEMYNPEHDQKNERRLRDKVESTKAILDQLNKSIKKKYAKPERDLFNARQQLRGHLKVQDRVKACKDVDWRVLYMEDYLASKESDRRPWDRKYISRPSEKAKQEAEENNEEAPVGKRTSSRQGILNHTANNKDDKVVRVDPMDLQLMAMPRASEALMLVRLGAEPRAHETRAAASESVTRAMCLVMSRCRSKVQQHLLNTKKRTIKQDQRRKKLEYVENR
jgi:hypothetical protein